MTVSLYSVHQAACKGECSRKRPRSESDGSSGETDNSQRKKRSRVSLNSKYQDLEEKLIQNYFSQLEEHNGPALKKIRRASRVFSGETSRDLMHLVDSVLELPQGTYRGQFDDFTMTLKKVIENLTTLNDKGNNTQRMTHTIQQVQGLCASSYTQINARGVHLATVRMFTEPMLRPIQSQVEDILKDIPAERQTALIKSLAEAWSSIKRKSSKLQDYSIVNIPNQAFDLVNVRNGSTINIIRMRSPELCPDEDVIDPCYRTMMESYTHQDKKHMDVSLVSLSKFDWEIIVNKLRHDIQLDYPGTLLSWASDAYSDFALQRGKYKKDESKSVSARVFISDFLKQILVKKKLSFIIPESFLKKRTFRRDMQNILQKVYEDVFCDGNARKRYLSCVERQDFVVIAVVYMIEYFCVKFGPQSIDTACRSHIDRGMVMTTVLYLYCLIKSGEIHGKEFMSYINLLVFPPSLLFAQRPTHLGRIKRLLSVMSRFLDPKVIERIQKRNSYFSRYKVTIPPEEKS